MQDYQLPYPVVNVLLEYILLSNNYKLPKNLTEKIAGHWKRLKIKTVDEALKIAKKEHQLYKDWQEGNKKTTNTASRNKEKNQKKEKKFLTIFLIKRRNIIKTKTPSHKKK
ncbi:DnaD domain protein [Tepidibacillus marianensis]|uniref:DnaD domain protein n=1 Tax=Tepidibacillus marianensis TaxID=3131995 RepID=UPI00386E23B3